MDGPAWLTLRAFGRGISLAAGFSVLGTLFLEATLLREIRLPGRARLLLWSAGLALVSGAAWFVLQAGYDAAAATPASLVAAIPIVATQTRFGTVFLVRLAFLLLATMFAACGWRRLAVLSGLFIVLPQAWLGHGAAMGGGLGILLLLPVSALHLLAAALWLGSLPGLFLALRQLPDEDAARLARRFSPLGLGCVALLILTALLQFWLLIASPTALFTTAYGRAALAKILILALLIALAARNRDHFTPALPASKPALLRNVGAEILLGLAAFVAAGFVLQFAPPAMAGMAGQ